MNMANSEVKPLHLDEVLLKFGLFGRYQMQMILLIGFAFFTNGMHCINYVFVAEDIPYRYVSLLHFTAHNMFYVQKTAQHYCCNSALTATEQDAPVLHLIHSRLFNQTDLT